MDALLSFGLCVRLASFALNGQVLRSISGQPVTVFGRRLVKMNFASQHSFLHFYVCDAYCVISVGRLLRQGYSVQLSSEGEEQALLSSHTW